jgi:hypothetical protein
MPPAANHAENYWASPILNARPEQTNFGEQPLRIEHFLPPELFNVLRGEISCLVETERSYLPAHKKGGAISYGSLTKNAPIAATLFRSDEMAKLISTFAGEAVVPTPEHDQSSCSILFYERPGDHIGWHYDHNFYRGRHLTVLISIINIGHGPGGLSSARLEARIGGAVRGLATPPNTLVAFEGQKVLHRVTPIEKVERRVMLSMTFATDSSASLAQGIKRRIKDIAFFGPRALWA